MKKHKKIYVILTQPKEGLRTDLECQKMLEKNYVKVYQHVEGGTSMFFANCPKCGSLLYHAEHPSTFKEVFPVERPFCHHCGCRVDSSKVQTDESKYCSSAG